MTFLGWLSDPFKGLSGLQLGDEKGTLNHLGLMFLLQKYPKENIGRIRCEEIVDSSQEMYCLKMFCRIFIPKILGEERSSNAF